MSISPSKDLLNIYYKSGIAAKIVSELKLYPARSSERWIYGKTGIYNKMQ